MDLLQDVKVVELSTFVAGPAAGGILADFGAEVIRVEQASGDIFISLSLSHLHFNFSFFQTTEIMFQLHDNFTMV